MASLYTFNTVKLITEEKQIKEVYRSGDIFARSDSNEFIMLALMNIEGQHAGICLRDGNRYLDRLLPIADLVEELLDNGYHRLAPKTEILLVVGENGNTRE